MGKYEEAKGAALWNYIYIAVEDGSRGVHNPWFARSLLRAAAARAEETWKRLDPERARAPFALDPPFATDHSCALLCHMGIEERAITLPGTRFDHTRHLGTIPQSPLRRVRFCDMLAPCQLS